jgi:hypothetical protein
MRLRATAVALLCLLHPALSSAQSPGVTGRFQDPITRAAVPGVQVKLTATADTSDVRRATAGDDGTFRVTGLRARQYRLEAARLGYLPFKTTVEVTKAGQDLGVIALTASSVPVSGITVNESPPPAVVKADTTEYRASAVKVNKDATAEDLVQKLPGVTLENGQVKAQGEAVQQVLVNGRPFFGSDPSAAMRNLPAEVVDRIQVYDRMSDQAEFSGFDDGQSQKTMNFILRNRKAQFGKVYAGGGDQGLYQAGGNASVVRGTTRATVIGMSNNVGQQNFSPQDLFGAMTGNGGGGGGPRIMMFGGGGGRRPGGGGPNIVRIGGGGFGGGAFDPGSFFVSPNGGLSTTNAGGANYTSDWGTTLKVSGSTFLNGSDTDNFQSLARQYLPPQDSLATYDQSALSRVKNGNQRFDGRLEWTPDSLNSVILAPRLYFQGTDTRSSGDAVNGSILGSPLSASSGTSGEVVDGNNLSTRLTLRHRFARRGRNVSADLSAGHTLRDATSAQYSLNDYWSGATVTSDTLDQQAASLTRTNSLSARVAWTEPLRPGLQAQLVVNPSLTRNTADTRTWRYDPATGTYSAPDTALTNRYANRTLQQNAALSVLWTRGSWRLLSSVAAQHTDLRSERQFPVSTLLDRGFDDVLPSAILSGTFANRRNLRLSWNTSTGNPSVSQLQDVVNNSNPLSLYTGNPSLRPTYTHSLMLRVSDADPTHSRSKFLFLNVSRTARTIANATVTALADTTVDGVFLARGTQLTKPENLGDSWNGNLFGVYSRPATWLKSIVSVNGGGSVTRTPTRLNGVTNVGTTWALRSGAVFASNISQNLDFTLSYQGTWNLSRNTRTTGNTGDSYSHNLGLRFNSVVGPGIVVREEVNHNLNSGVQSGYGQDIVLWNSTIGKKFLKDQKAELRVTATDVLRQNSSLTRTTTEAYVQDSRDRVLGRYVQAVLTYSFR